MIWILLAVSAITLYYIYYIINYRSIVISNQVVIKVFNLLNAEGVDASHGMSHILEVLKHAQLAMASVNLTPKQTVIVELACLLHDADDSKYFKTTNYQNARKILNKTFPHLTDIVVECISIVSASENGNTIDPSIPIWKYIPRFADRLEAMGDRGIERTLTYNAHKKTPTHLPTTIQVKTRSELESLNINDRFTAYQNGKKSESVVDHFYDKLFHLRVKTGNPYIDSEMEARHEVMVNWVLNYWNTNS